MAEGFESFELDPKLLQGIRDMGFREPFPDPGPSDRTPIEGEGSHRSGSAGSGKTLAYALPMLHRIQPQSRDIQGLVLLPTRELALQVAGEFERLARHTPSRTMPVYGGASMRVQIEKFQRNYAKIVVATPGRLLDHLKRRSINLQATSFVVIDEADRMLDMGLRQMLLRGLDIPWVSHVVNYDMLEDPTMYFHRVGRTARAGERGASISLVS